MGRFESGEQGTGRRERARESTEEALRRHWRGTGRHWRARAGTGGHGRALAGTGGHGRGGRNARGART